MRWDWSEVRMECGEKEVGEWRVVGNECERNGVWWERSEVRMEWCGNGVW